MEQNNFIIKTMEEVIHESMIPYSEVVILDRALPRVEDGLKPVQRRILFDMLELGLTPDKPYKKCARVVGDCLGKYHPHGDSSVYQALVRLAQPFNMGATLVDGQGNFGDVDGNGAAAMRYTECRLTPLAMEMMKGMGSPGDEIVPWNSNFDDQLKEPALLPGRFPNLLVNGASGIAIGFATNIPTHNLAEVIDGAVKYIDNPKITLKELMKTVKGPDFPTGGYIIGGEELYKAYETGKGRIFIRAKVHIEPGEYDKTNIVIDELPYQVNRAKLLEDISKLKDSKKEEKKEEKTSKKDNKKAKKEDNSGVLAGIHEITDESDRHGTRCVIKVKKDYNYKAILDILFKSTDLSVSYSINTVAIADGKPQTLGLLDIYGYYVNYQRDYIVKRTKCELDAAKKREHILEGLVIAVQNIDEVVKTIKNSKSTSEAKDNLRRKFSLSERQAEAILELKLARLTHLEVFKLEQELAELRKRIEYLSSILASKKMQMEVVKEEMLAIKKAFKMPRKSVIIDKVEDYEVPSGVKEPITDDSVVTYNALGNIKRTPLKSFNRSTRKFSDTTGKAEICSIIEQVKIGQKVIAFGESGTCYKVDIEAMTESRWKENGYAVNNVIPSAPKDEKIIFMRAVGEEMPTGHLLFYTKNGLVKKAPWSEYAISRASAQAIVLKGDDKVIGIEEARENVTLMTVTKKGMCLNSPIDDLPVYGRTAAGVKAIHLNADDEVLTMTQVEDVGEMVLITDKSNAKRVTVGEIDILPRNRKGVKAFGLKGAIGSELVFARYVTIPYTIVLHVEDDYFSAFDTEDIIMPKDRTLPGKPLVRGCQGLEGVYVYNTEITIHPDQGEQA